MAFSPAILVLSLFSLGACQVHFDCPPLPSLQRSARNVYELRPQDIKVVMALGDSITAGYGMMGSHGANVSEDLAEYRGQSWSIGMDEGAQTVPNFLKTYNPAIVGGSVGEHILESCYGILCPSYGYHPEYDILNAAQSGAMVTDLVSHEFGYLLEQLKKHKEIDIENDWKLLTFFVGTNDLCLGCSGKFPSLTVDDYENHTREVLEEVRKNIPKVFVNLVLLGNISGIYTLSLQSKYCVNIHRIFSIECICAFSPGEIGNKSRLALDEMVVSVNKRLKKIAAEYASKKYPDFAVVVQPFFSGAQPNRFTVDFLSALDCFHPSLLAHQNMAKALWNNMITPAANKDSSFEYKEPFICPTNMTLLYTN